MKSKNHPSMRMMPTMPYLPRIEEDFIAPLTDEEIAFAIHVFEEQIKQG